MSEDTNVTCSAEFVVVQGKGQTLLKRSTAEKMNLLRVGPAQVNEVTDVEGMVKETYPELFRGVPYYRAF